ncbi:MAG: pyridoxamine 5'-phosphate oxidase family protein, partial [Clostridia bacterium]|nr:pyridoxamine 5'-phosphate oxidase family protein [Clostridia bacterium]
MAFREMRRKDRQVFDELLYKILEKGEYGVLSVHGDNGYPYGVPVNYVYLNENIYFHSAKTGHKLDAVKADGRVSF